MPVRLDLRKYIGVSILYISVSFHFCHYQAISSLRDYMYVQWLHGLNVIYYSQTSDA